MPKNDDHFCRIVFPARDGDYGRQIGVDLSEIFPKCSKTILLSHFMPILTSISTAKVVDVLLRVDHNHALKNTEPLVFVVKTVAF